MITYRDCGTIRMIDDEVILIKLIEYLHDDIRRQLYNKSYKRGDSIDKVETDMVIEQSIKTILYNEFNISMYYVDELLKKANI